MSTKGAKGKGKSRGGGGMNAQGRRSRSRNTTPASGSAFSGDTISDFPLPSSTSFLSRRTYDDLFERLNLSENPSIPNSGTLVALRQELGLLKDSATERSQSSEKALLAMKARREERAAREKAELAERESERKAVEDAEKKERMKLKKRKAEPEHKRPLAVGAHQVTGQGPSIDGEKRKKLRSNSPEIKRGDSEESGIEHQPAQAAPFVVFEPLGDDPTVYEIPKVDDTASYLERAKAYAVARFPADDLANLITGYPPDEDFSKAKPTNQVGIATFNAYIEPYFRPFSEEDLAFLRERGDRLQPYIIPKLGKHYSEIWAEEDGPGPSFASPAPVTNSSCHKSANAPRGKPDDLSDEQLDKEEVACGPLLTRLLSLYMNEDGDGNGDLTLPVNGDSPLEPARTYAASLPNSAEVNWKIPTGKMDYAFMDERIRREMVHVGLLDPSQELDYDTQLDDEVSGRLRKLQKQLKEQSILNGARKARIAEQLKEQLAYQEYVTILEDLDKQVEQAFAKRSRNMKASKKKKNIPNGVGVARAHVGIGEQARLLMERRKRWIDTIGPVFDKDLGILPEGTIFNNLNDLVEREKLEAAEEE